MKLFKSSLYAAVVLMASAAVTSCSSDPDYDSSEIIVASDGNFSFNTAGVWVQNLQSGNFEIDDYIFSHAVPYEGYANGFTPSKVADNSLREPLFSYPYCSAAGGGITGQTPYLVGYWDAFSEGTNPTFDDRSCRIWEEDLEQFRPQSVMVCVNTYLYYAVLNGTDFSKKFGPGDWVTLTAHGVHLDGTEATAVFHLVNIESTDVESGICKQWTQFDLTDLGTCTGIYFTMDSNDKGDYGINVPTYFCIDKLVVED